MKKRYSIADARNRLPALVHEVERGGAVEITRRGRPVAVLVSEAEYSRLTNGRGGYWEALQRWREDNDLEGMDEMVETILASRDRSPGRDVTW
jgi:prevent-host-death family protein